ncbi:MAG: hypothetical protein GX237_02920 [Clostridiales bacterium]|nr:hypothetical protein [Clostridiales bacterium]
MTGLEKIIKAIEAEASKNVEDILAKAKEESQKILASAKSEAEAKSAEIAKKPASEIKAIINKANSSAGLIKRQAILSAKQEVIGEIIDKAKIKLTSLPDNDYFDLILQIVKKHAQSGEGIIMFREEDLKRLPKKFDKSLKEALEDIKNASLTISDNFAKIDGGFIIAYGDVEINCSFEALFNKAKDELQDKVNAFLFE